MISGVFEFLRNREGESGSSAGILGWILGWSGWVSVMLSSSAFSFPTVAWDPCEGSGEVAEHLSNRRVGPLLHLLLSSGLAGPFTFFGGRGTALPPAGFSGAIAEDEAALPEPALGGGSPFFAAALSKPGTIRMNRSMALRNREATASAEVFRFQFESARIKHTQLQQCQEQQARE